MLTLDWFWFWQKPDIDFTTPLLLGECRDRLTSTLKYRRGLFSIQSEHPVIGEVEGNRFYLTKSPTWFRDDFRPFLYGNLIASGQNTRVQAFFRLHAIMTLTIFAGVSLLLGLSVGNAFLVAEPLWPLITLSIFWIMALAILITFIWFGSWSRKSSHADLADYLHKTLLPDNSEYFASKKIGDQR